MFYPITVGIRATRRSCSSAATTTASPRRAIFRWNRKIAVNLAA
jgi:hypothetical protein